MILDGMDPWDTIYPDSGRPCAEPIPTCRICGEDVPNEDAGSFDVEGPTCNECIRELNPDDCAYCGSERHTMFSCPKARNP